MGETTHLPWYDSIRHLSIAGIITAMLTLQSSVVLAVAPADQHVHVHHIIYLTVPLILIYGLLPAIQWGAVRAAAFADRAVEGGESS